MNVRPILFSALMIRALLDGAKTQTRRIVKPQPPAEAKAAGVIASCTASNGIWWWLDSPDLLEASTVGDEFSCPYGTPGDLLWVKERHAYVEVMKSTKEFKDAAASWVFSLEYSDGSERPERLVQPEKPRETRARGEQGWRPSIHMPRWASRLTLELTDVRVQRLQEISNEDARAEGARICAMQESRGLTHRSEFSGIWAEVNGAASWDANPWVWALTFNVHRRNIEALLQQRTAA